ncbi:MAG: dual specificity protein phosphatase family protein [Planctomycetes bacterium]|nr:dual specificity protein phosphatase family protein [Planctomycetota bacterium]
MWHRYVEDLFFPRRWAVVEPGSLYRSGLIAPRLIRGVLEEYNIQVIVDLTAFGPNAEQKRAEEEAVKALGIRHLELPLSGSGTGDIHYYAEAVAAIARARRENKPVLVHCVNGSCRTGGVIAAYRLLVQRKPPEGVYEEMCEYTNSPVASPELLAYLNGNMAKLAKLLVEMGVVDRVPDPAPQLRPPGRGPRQEEGVAKADDE